MEQQRVTNGDIGLDIAAFCQSARCGGHREMRSDSNMRISFTMEFGSVKHQLRGDHV